MSEDEDTKPTLREVNPEMYERLRGENKNTLILLLCLIIVGLVWGIADAKADSPELNQLATQLAGRSVTVECFPTDGVYGGYIVINDGVMEPVIHLDGHDCGALQNVLTPGPRTAHWLRSFEGQQDVGVALQDLTHEATHQALQSADEGIVECTAYKNVWNAVKLLPIASWRIREGVYDSAKNAHYAMPLTGANRIYRSVC